MNITLPEPLSRYFAAANAKDAEGVAACFGTTATVRDEQRDIQGRDAIRRWADETARTYRYTSEVRGVERLGDATVVTARLTGDFSGSPIDLRYRFMLAGGSIAALEITP